MYYYLYEITNTINKMIYIGVHKTKDLNDEYFGSGADLIPDIKKYGTENFEKKILKFFSSSNEMYQEEGTIVNEDFVARDDTYNLKTGGHGGWDYANKDHAGEKNSRYGITLSDELKDKISKILKTFYKNPKNRKMLSDGQRKFYDNGGIGSFTGKSHTESAKIQMSESHQGKHEGKKNSQYGMMWIYNLDLKQSKRIKKTDEIPDGWLKGRKMKF